MAQYLYIDNRDGFGPRDFTRYLWEADQFFTHTKNEPQLFDFNIVNIDADNTAAEFVIPKRGAHIRFFDERWDSRHSEVENGVLFTGYLTEEPDPIILGLNKGEKVWGYRLKCTSEEFLANSRPMPNKTYVNKTRGFILKDLLQEMFKESVPFPFNTDGIRDGGVERLFQVDTGQKWAELAAAFAGADGFTYYVIDGFIFYGPQDKVTTYADPYYCLTIDEFDPRFASEALDIRRVARDIVNDVTVLGLDEPADTVREHFVSDGYQGFHNLAFDPYGIAENVLLNDDFTAEIDASTWEEKDTGANYIQFFDGALNITGGPGVPGSAGTARTVYLLSTRPIEMSGIIEFRDGEIYFPPGPTGTGIIGGLYTDTTLSQNALWNGWYLDCTNRLLQPVGPGQTPIGDPYTFVATRHYVLRRTIQIDRPVSSPQLYLQQSTGATYSYASVSDPKVTIFFVVDEINNDDPAAVTTRTTEVAKYSLVSANPPDFLLYAAVAPNNCHYVTNYLSIQKPQQAVLKVNGLQQKLGSYLDGGKAVLQSENGMGKLAWYATPTGAGTVPTSYINTILGDGVNIFTGAAGPVAYWRLGEIGTSTYRDSTGHGHDGTSSGVTQGEPGALSADSDTATSFNGSTSYISGAGFQTAMAGAGSIEGWFKTTATGVNTIYSTRNVGGSGEFVSVYNGQLMVGSDYGGSEVSNRSGLNDGRWHHFAVTFRDGGGANCTLYLDGAFDRTMALPRLPPANQWYLGRDRYVETITPGAGYFHGILDEIAIYKDIELTAVQVKNHYSIGVSTSAQAVTIPPAGSSIELSYYRRRLARARMRSTESIKTERERYRDDGVRQRTIRAEDISPAPRTSEECLALAQAYLNDSSRARYEGSYSFQTLANTPTDLGFWPRPGDVVECSLPLPTGPIVSEPLTLQTVNGRFLGKDAYQINLDFGPVNRWDIVLRNLILKRKSSFEDPVIQVAEADTLEIVNQAYPYPADLLDCTVTAGSITASQFAITLAQSGIPADVVNYEVRSDDTGWGNTNMNSGYITRFRSQSHTFNRTARDLLYYIRPYNAAGAYAKRSATLRIACPTTNTFTMAGVTGNVSGQRIRVIVPIPRDPDYAGIIVRLGDAGSVSASSPIIYQGNGDQNIIVGNGVEVLVTVGKITVDIPNTLGLQQCYVWANTYNLLKLEGTAQSLLISSLADGAWGNLTYNPSNFTAAGGGWNVEGPDQVVYSYTKNINTLTVTLDVVQSSISGGPSILQANIPLGLTATGSCSTTCYIKNSSTAQVGVMSVDLGGTVIKIRKLDGTAFANDTNTAEVKGQLAFPV